MESLAVSCFGPTAFVVQCIYTGAHSGVRQNAVTGGIASAQRHARCLTGRGKLHSLSLRSLFCETEEIFSLTARPKPSHRLSLEDMRGLGKTAHTLHGGLRLNRETRAGAKVEETIFEDGDLYEPPDEFGGWKGIRKSALTTDWEKKGRQVTVRDHDWFVVDEGPFDGTTKSTVLLVPGLPAHSYSYREVVRILSDAGHQAVSFDWPGFGLSDKPSPKAFGYRTDDFLEGLEGLVGALGLGSVTLVAQGFLGGTVGIQYAAAHPETVTKLVIMNAPLQKDCKLPKPFQQFTLPFIGAAFAQDPTRLADRIFNCSGPYEMAEDDLQVYRQPYMESSDAGFAVLAAVKNMDLKADVARCRDLLTSDSFRTPTLLTLCDQDKWLSQPFEVVKALSGRPWFSTTVLEGAGHFAQEDWPEKVAAAIRRLQIDPVHWSG